MTNKKSVRYDERDVWRSRSGSEYFAEPDRKNTAACIAYATLLLKKKLGKACFALCRRMDMSGIRKAMLKLCDRRSTLLKRSAPWS